MLGVQLVPGLVLVGQGLAMTPADVVGRGVLHGPAVQVGASPAAHAGVGRLG